MSRIARFIVEHSRVVLALTALISILSVLMLFRMSFNADISSFLLEGNATGQEFVAVQDKYATTDPINVVASLPDGQTFTTSDNLALIAELRDSLSAVEGVVSVAAVVPESNPITGAPLDAAALASAPDALVVGLLSQNPISELLVSEDGAHTLLIVSPGDDATGTARRVANVTQDGLELTFSGNPVVFASVLDLLTWFLLIIPPLVIALLILTFFTTIGDLRLSAMALIPAALGSLWTFGLIFGLGNQVDIVTVIVPIFVIVMGSADGLTHPATRTVHGGRHHARGDHLLLLASCCDQPHHDQGPKRKGDPRIAGNGCDQARSELEGAGDRDLGGDPRLRRVGDSTARGESRPAVLLQG
jgi:predicted RND superfamily exporter protein